MCSFSWAICFILVHMLRKRGGALGIHQGGVTLVAALWCCMWGRGWEGAMALVLLSASFPSLPPLPASKLGAPGTDSQVGGFVYTLGPCGSLEQTLLWGWEFLLLPPQPPQVFSIRGLRLYFPELEPWVAWSVSLPSCSSRFIGMRMRDRPLYQLPPRWVHQPLPCCESSLPWLPISTPPTGLYECFFFISLVVRLPYSSIFCQFWLLFVFKLLSFWLWEEAQCVCLCLHLGWKFSFIHFYAIQNLGKNNWKYKWKCAFNFWYIFWFIC